MLLFMQLLNRVQDKQFFIDLFDDLSFELDELGYRDDPTMLVDELLLNHFGIEMQSDMQLERLTDFILKKQGSLKLYWRMVG